MRRRKDECNPSSTGSSGDSSHPLHDNAFAPELFDELRERDFAPACPEGELNRRCANGLSLIWAKTSPCERPNLARRRG
jgi:hypothetical protein